MSFFLKINRGLILTVVIVLATTGYLVVNGVAQSTAKPEIKTLCEKYIKTAISYKMLPQNYRKENPAVPKAELDKYVDDMTRDLKAFYSNNEQTYKYTIADYKKSLENQAKGIGVIYNFTKEISDYKDFVFDNDTVTVTITTNTFFDGMPVTGNTPSKFMQGAEGRQNITTQTTDTITLQNVSGKWKVLYADLVNPVSGGMQGYTPQTTYAK